MSNRTNLKYSLITSVWSKKGRDRQGKTGRLDFEALGTTHYPQSPIYFVCSAAAHRSPVS